MFYQRTNSSLTNLFLKILQEKSAGRKILFKIFREFTSENINSESPIQQEKENTYKHPKITKMDNINFESNSYGEDMIINKTRKSNTSNFDKSDSDTRNSKRGFGDFGAEANKYSRSDKFRKEGDDYSSGKRDFSRKPRDFAGEEGEFNKRPRKNFDNREFKKSFREEDGFNARENRAPRFRSSDFSERDNRSYRNDRDESKGRVNRDRDSRDKPFNRDRTERSFGERPPRREGGFGDRPPKQDGGFGERPPRREGGFGDRPPKQDGGFGERQPRREGGFGDRPPKQDGGSGERPPRRDRDDYDRGSGEKPFRTEKKSSEREYGERPFSADSDRLDRGFEDRPPRTDKLRSERSQDRFDNQGTKDGFRNNENRKTNRDDSSSNFKQNLFGDIDKPRSTRPIEKKTNFDNFKSQSTKENFNSGASDFNDVSQSIKNKTPTQPKTENLFSKKIEKDIKYQDDDINRITLANLKFKKDVDTTKVEEHQKEESKKREEEIVEYRDSKKDYLYGMHSVQAALTYNFRKNLELLIDNNFKENIPDHILKILELAKTKDVKTRHMSRDRLDKLTGGRPHNGVVLKSDIRDYIYLSNFSNLEKHISKPEGNLLILLDQIVDPQNFGSVIRSAFFLGADAIMLNKKNKPPISSTVCKVSSGASECIDLFAVKSLRSFLKESVDKGWTVITASIEKESDVQMRLDGGTQNSSNNLNFKEQHDASEENQDKSKEDSSIESKTVSLNDLKLSNTANVILVLGSEASGITSNITGMSHYNIFIPPMLSPEETGKHPFTLIDSLNVGVSAGIIINHLKSQLKNFQTDSEKI